MVGRLVEIHGSVIDLRYGERVDGGRLVVDCILRFVVRFPLFFELVWYYNRSIIRLHDDECTR